MRLWVLSLMLLLPVFGWSQGFTLNLLGGVSVPTGELGEAVVGQKTGPHFGATLEKQSAGKTSWNLNLEFHSLPNDIAIQGLSPLRIWTGSWNGNYVLSSGSFRPYVTGGIGIGMRSFTAENIDTQAKVTLSSTEFLLRVGAGFDLAFLGLQDFFVEGAYNALFAEDTLGFLPIRAGYRIRL